ncbi:UDP-glucose dehydrogenase family protein [Candidatus Zixiibacteriota bacterium]
MNIAVIGLGHTGLVAAAVLAEVGHQVIGHDIESEKCAIIRRGNSPFHEPGLEGLINRGRQSGRLAVADSLEESLAGAEVIFLAVGTPAANGDSPNLAEFWSAAGQVVPAAPKNAILAIKSTLPVGTTDKLISRFKSIWPGEAPVVVVPEFLRQGSAVADFRRPDRVVLGSHSPEARATVRRVFELFDLPTAIFHECTPMAAELIKHATNCFLATKISFANELANLCGHLGVDYEVIRRGLAADTRIGAGFMHAGLGFGGSCFPKDVAALIETGRKAECRLTLLETALVANRAQVKRVVDLIRDILGEIKGKKILQLGLTYKPGTDDIRGSLSLELAFLLSRGGADLTCYDPAYQSTAVGSDNLFDLADDPLPAAVGAELIIIATDWPQFGELPWSEIAKSMKVANLLDGRNMLNPQKLDTAGFTYRGIGR